MGSTVCRFCGSADARRAGHHTRQEILDEYRLMYGLTFPPQIIETSFAFTRLVVLECLRCRTLRFDPVAAGDSAYYAFLSEHVSWYYKTHRWEFPIVASILEEAQPGVFLDVGCGDGHFLKLARSRGLDGHGFETNPRSVAILKALGIVTPSDLNEGLGQYDAIVLLQVLEHMPDPFELLESLVGHLSAGGLLVLSTPVTPSCLSFAMPALALPPHHQWLPTVAGFRCLGARLGLTCETVRCDPPDPSQVTFGLRRRFGPVPFLGKVAGWTWKMAKAFQLDWAAVGHTGLIVLRKPAAVNSNSRSRVA